MLLGQTVYISPFYFTGSESDSTDEPVVGNVSKFAVVPPGYSGRPKKGHLIFDACFECGKIDTRCCINFDSMYNRKILALSLCMIEMLTLWI